MAVPALRAPLPFNQVRRVIGTSQAVVLVVSMMLAALLPGLASGGWLALLPGLALLAMLWSFGRDVWRQLRP